MVGFANITAREMLDHLFLTYGNITAVDLENNFEQMRKACDPQQPVETLFKQIQDFADFLEAGEVLTGHPQHINVGYDKIFVTGNFMSACRRWNEKDTADKTWSNFKVHFAAAHRQHKQIQGGSADNSGYHAANADVGQTEDQLAEAIIGALANLATATATERSIVTTLTEANSRLAKQLEYISNELKDIKALLKKERAYRKGKRTFNPSPDNYCWTHGYKVANSHTGLSCNYPKHGHKREPLRQTTWEAAKQTENDVQGRYL
jgi:hypothetical protein